MGSLCIGQWLYIGLRFSFFCNVVRGGWSSPPVDTLNNNFHNSTYNYFMGLMCLRDAGSFLAQLTHWLLPSGADITRNYRSFLILNLTEMAELSPDSPGHKRNNDHITPKRKVRYQQGSPSGCAIVKSQSPEMLPLMDHSYVNLPANLLPRAQVFLLFFKITEIFEIFCYFLFFILRLSTSHYPHLGGRGAPFCLMWAKCPGGTEGVKWRKFLSTSIENKAF